MPLRKRCVGFEDAFPGSRDSGGFTGLGGATKHFRVGRCSSPHPPNAVVQIWIIRDEAACGVSRWKHGATELTLHLQSSCGHPGGPPAPLRLRDHRCHDFLIHRFPGEISNGRIFFPARFLEMSFLQSIFFLKIFLEKWVKGKAPATPETKMHDLAAPAD